MDGFYCFVVAGVTEGFFDDGLEGFLLITSRKRKRAAEHLLNKGIVQVIAVLGIVQSAVQVGGAVIEGREKETELRHLDYPVTDAVLEAALQFIVAQAWLGQIYRADRAENVAVNLIRGILHLNAVGSLSRDIIGIVDQQDQIVAHIIVILNDTVIERV